MHHTGAVRTARRARRPQSFGSHGNAKQFLLLLLLVVFVGAVVGVERSVLPLLAEQEFGVASATATLSFLVAFGLAKALSNLLAGGLAGRIGRRRVLLLAWLLGLPVPFLLFWAPSWAWVGVANLLLGANQGLAWSSIQIMKLDLVGRRRRGFAMGANECAGYLAVAAAALLGGVMVPSYGARAVLLVIPLTAVLLGLAVTWTTLRETAPPDGPGRTTASARAGSLSGPALVRLRELSFGTRARLAANQAGLVVNLKEGVAWGLLPLYLATRGLGAAEIAGIAALYPAVWGLAQLGTGALSDRWGRRPLIAGGMLVQATALTLFALLDGVPAWTSAAVLLGLGTAAAYPTLIAQTSDLAGAELRPGAIGTYRLWRDLGYVAGGLSAGMAADIFGYGPAILFVACLVAASAALTVLLLPAPEADRAGGAPRPPSGLAVTGGC